MLRRWYLRAPTCRATVAAQLVARHAQHILDDGFGEVLQAVLAGAALLAAEGHVQGLLLAVGQHRDPAVQRNKAPSWSELNKNCVLRCSHCVQSGFCKYLVGK